MDHGASLPTGVVTFLLTDIEGSTRRWEREPELMRGALARHDSILATTVRRQNGFVVKSKGEGDSVFAVFRHVRDAVTAALIAQCAMLAERWSTSTPIRVRMAIHTGQIELRDGDYFGPTVNRCARLRGLAAGGEILLSGVTAQLVNGRMPPEARLVDLGMRKLKDLSAPERVWQVSHPRLEPVGAAGADQAKSPAVEVPAANIGYVLTDHLNRSMDGLEWGEGVAHRARPGQRLRCYTSPAIAALLNTQHERLRLPRLWEASVDQVPPAGAGVIECGEISVVRQLTMPTLSGMDHARFAVLCVQAVGQGEWCERIFSPWAESWLNGQDQSAIQARAVADAFDAQARDDSGLAHPELAMAANAARAATHASKLSWLVGRARDEENVRALGLASQALHVALRMAEPDLPALAEQAAPRLNDVVSLGRHPVSLATARILRTLPT